MTKQKLIVMDLDGTFCDSMKWQKQYFTNGVEDEEGYHSHISEFPVNEMLLEMVRLYIEEGYEVLFLSARPDKYYKQTVQWFSDNTNRRFDLFDVERHHNCYLTLKTVLNVPTPEWEVRVLNSLQKDYDIRLCVDDNPKVCKAFREAGYNCLQMESLY